MEKDEAAIIRQQHINSTEQEEEEDSNPTSTQFKIKYEGFHVGL